MDSDTKKQVWVAPKVERFGTFAEATQNIGSKALGISDGDITSSSQQLASV